MVDNVRMKKAATVCDIDAFKECAKKAGGHAEQLMNMLEKTDRLTCEYFLAWQNEFHKGGTEYIDGVRPSSVNQSVQWGIDPWKRIFVTFRFTDTNKSHPAKEQAAAVFQRYTDESLIVSGGHFANSLFFSPRAFHDPDMKKLEALLDKGSMDYTDYMNETNKLVLTDSKTPLVSPKDSSVTAEVAAEKADPKQGLFQRIRKFFGYS